MTYKIRVDYAQVEVCEDTYEEGMGKYIQTFDLYDMGGNIYDDVQSIIMDVNRRMDVFSTDISDWCYIDGRIDTDAEVNADNEEPTGEEYAAWREGRLMLYIATLSCGVTMVPAGGEHEMTEEEAEAYGLPTV